MKRAAAPSIIAATSKQIINSLLSSSSATTFTTPPVTSIPYSNDAISNTNSVMEIAGGNLESALSDRENLQSVSVDRCETYFLSNQNNNPGNRWFF